MDTLQGTIDTIRFQKEDTSWTVAMLDDGTTVTGVLVGVYPGTAVDLVGQWDDHKTYGRQFKVHSYRASRPTNIESLTVYLQEMVNGIGPHLAQMITKHFGPDTVNAMTDPRRLAEVPGIGTTKAAAIVKSWAEHEAERAVLEDLLAFFVENGLHTSLAHKAFKAWGFAAVEKINANPYILIDLEGVGFKRADDIARRLSVEATDPNRVQAALEYNLAQSSMLGHCFLERDRLILESVQLLQIDATFIQAQIAALRERDRIIIEGEAVYLKRLWNAETQAAGSLLALLRGNAVLSGINTTTLPGDITYTDTQAAAIRAAFAHKVSIVTGGPGTGKTTITRAIVELATQATKSVVLCSPTGKAAKRLSQATGREAATIHRTLGVDPLNGGFIHNHDNPLYADLVIVDEASMLDISLARHLLDAIHPRAHVVIVGDVDQLPSVGPGNVLRDMIASGVIPVTRLDTIFRQGDDSFIIPNAHAINAGEMPTYNTGLGGDFYLDSADDAETAARKVVQLVTERIPRAFGFPPSAIQVLTPMHRGEAGDNDLNKALQAILNPPSPQKEEVTSGFNTFRVGDSVMQCKNNYDLDVFNGDQGTIKRIAEDDDGKPTVWIDFDGELKKLRQGDLAEMRLAYAITVHKSQGSEFPVVVMPVLTQHYVMLQRNLLYTGVTRAKKLVVLVGNSKAVGIAVYNDKIALRNTMLAERLKGIV